MDQFARAFYELAFKVKFMEAHGQAFQDFFADVMEKRYPGDFHRVKPWGRLGDLKNDGYQVSSRTLFQVYGPSDLAASETIAKMEADFEGGIANWRPHTDRWVFVTTERDGLPAPVEQKLLELGKRHEGVSVASWGFEELRQLLFELPDADIAAVLGPSFTRVDVVEVRYSDLDPILDGIAGRIARVGGEVAPVSQGKLDANGLSDYVKLLLSAGIQGAKQVEDYFRDNHDATLGDRVAAAFTEHYVVLRDAHTPADDVFTALRAFAIGPTVLSPRREAAALALLAYLFERCDIYEAARAGAS